VGVIGVFLVRAQLNTTSVEGQYSRIGIPSGMHQQSAQQLQYDKSVENSANKPKIWQYEYSFDGNQKQIIQEYAKALEAAGFVNVRQDAASASGENGHISVKGKMNQSVFEVTAMEMK